MWDLHVRTTFFFFFELLLRCSIKTGNDKEKLISALTGHAVYLVSKNP